jgi:subtilase family serine protease
MGNTRLGGVAAGILFAFAAPAGASAAPTAQVARVGAAPPSARLEIVLPLKADLVGLRRTALAITTPGSPAYGRYEPLSRLAQRFGASASTRRRVTTYLQRAGARDVRIDVTGLFAEASLSVGSAERAFATPLAQFRSAHGARFIAPDTRSASASAASARVPPALRGAVTAVIGLDQRPLAGAAQLTHSPARAHAASQPTSARPRTGTPDGCPEGIASGGFTPNQYLSAYGYEALRAAGLSGQGERVALIEVDGFKYSDLMAFAQCFSLPIPALNTFGVGIKHLLSPGGEATLDLEVLDAAAPGLASINVFETKASAADTLRALTAPLRTKQKPQVISASLGLCEQALRHFVGNAGIETTEGALEAASATGITFVASSGDQGSADCTSTRGTPLRLLAVNYPASSWWVTGVGGTNLVLNPANQIASEVVWNDASEEPGSAGGGGASVLLPRPNYQRGATRSRTRVVPDVSMLSDIEPGYAIFCSARDPNCITPDNNVPWEALGGTSAATPLLAGGLAIVDQQLRAAHKQPLGLVNPLLYATARSSSAHSVFFDVTSLGNDIGPDLFGRRPLGCCSARPGFDATSGIGSVNVAGLAARAVQAQPPVITIGLSVPSGQHPVSQRAIEARVSCSSACVMGAYADVSIARNRPFEVDSRVTRMRHGGTQTIPVRFSSGQLAKIRAALGAHKRVSAIVHAVLLDADVYNVDGDASGSLSQRTPGQRISIR